MPKMVRVENACHPHPQSVRQPIHPPNTPVKHHSQNAELFTLTYGAMVLQLIRDYEDVQAVNTQLEKMCVATVVCVGAFSAPIDQV